MLDLVLVVRVVAQGVEHLGKVRITEDIPSRVAADTAYRNAKKNSDKQNARIEHDKALARVMTAVLKDDTESSSSSATIPRSRSGTDTIFAVTYASDAA